MMQRVPARAETEANWSRLFERNTGRDMMHIPNLAVTTITLMCLAVALPTIPVLAQERLVFRVSAENTKYTQQNTIDVGDVAGHQVRIFEIKRVYPSNAPLIGGVKIVGLWERGGPGYTHNSGGERKSRDEA